MSEKTEELVKTIGDKLNGITAKVQELVLGSGELIVTISVIIGLITALIGGIADMGNVGFFTGLSSMLSNMISVIMGSLVIFLLFAIYKNGEKTKTKK